jgi:hypothetical protein
MSECNKCINEERLNRLIDFLTPVFFKSDLLIVFLYRVATSSERLVGLSFQPKVAKKNIFICQI